MVSATFAGLTYSHHTSLPCPTALSAVHKTQGIGLSHAVVDLGPGLFADGQAYVALSRVRSLGGVALLGLSGAQQVCSVNPVVLQYYQRLGFAPDPCWEREPREDERVRQRVRARAAVRQADAAGARAGPPAAGQRDGVGAADEVSAEARLEAGQEEQGQQQGQRQQGRQEHDQHHQRQQQQGGQQQGQQQGHQGQQQPDVSMAEACEAAGTSMGVLAARVFDHNRDRVRPRPSWPPPSNELAVLSAHGSYVPNTYSWFLVPFFAHALGAGHLFPEFPASDPSIKFLLSDAAALLMNRTWAGVRDRTSARPYITAGVQEELLALLAALDADLEVDISAYAGALAQAACEELNALQQQEQQQQHRPCRRRRLADQRMDAAVAGPQDRTSAAPEPAAFVLEDGDSSRPGGREP